MKCVSRHSDKLWFLYAIFYSKIFFLITFQKYLNQYVCVSTNYEQMTILSIFFHKIKSSNFKIHLIVTIFYLTMICFRRFQANFGLFTSIYLFTKLSAPPSVSIYLYLFYTSCQACHLASYLDIYVYPFSC